MKNIGFALYRKGDEPGSLDAIWCHSNSGSGSGKATGGPKRGFAGDYHIRYFDEVGGLDGDLKLTIRRRGTFYELSWVKDGKETCVGMGMEVKEGLSVGWRVVDD